MSGRIVTVKSLTKKYKYATFISCPHTIKGGYLTGEKHLPGKLKNSEHRIKPTDRPAITHAMQLDLSREDDMCMYAYLLDLEEVANRLSVAEPEMHLFYIEDPQEEAELSNKQDELIMEAFTLIAENTSRAARENVMYFLGNNPKGKTDEIIKNVIYTTAKNSPQRIVDAFGKGAKYVRFVNELIINGIIKQKNKIYFFEDTVLGTGIDEVVLYVMNEKHASTIESLGAHLTSAKGGTGAALEETVVLIFPDGHQESINEAKADKLLAEYNIQVPPVYKLNGKSKALQKHFDALKIKE